MIITTHDDEERKAFQQNPRIRVTFVQRNKHPTVDTQTIQFYIIAAVDPTNFVINPVQHYVV